MEPPGQATPSGPRAAAPVGLLAMLRAGWRDLGHYTGTVFALYVVQLVVTLIAIAGVAQVFASRFAMRPILDDAVDGDLVALIEILRTAPEVLWAAGWVAVTGVLVWWMGSWFLTGGTLAVLLERPTGRAVTARTFGAGGATTFLTYLRLAVFGLLLVIPSLVVLTMGMAWAAGRLEFALSMREVYVALLGGLLPGLVCLALASTIIEQARIELSVRRDSDDATVGRQGALAALLRGGSFVLRHPRVIGHALLMWGLWLALGLLFVWMAVGRDMLGTRGAYALFILRQGVALARMACKVALLAGQVEARRPALGLPAVPPPKAALTKPDRRANAERA